MVLSRFGPENKRVVSSANKVLNISERKNGKSLIKIRKNNGPRTLPCGTPNRRLARSDVIFDILVHW